MTNTIVAIKMYNGNNDGKYIAKITNASFKVSRNSEVYMSEPTTVMLQGFSGKGYASEGAAIRRAQAIIAANVNA